MTSKPTPSRFRIRRSPVAAAPQAAEPASAAPPEPDRAEALPAAPPPAPSPSPAAPPAQVRQGPPPQPAEPEAGDDPALAAIRAEGLTGRQLRMARRVAQRYGIAATSDLDAVRLLRARGIDPFGRTALLDLVAQEPAGARAGVPATVDPAEPERLPKTWRAPATAPQAPAPGGSPEFVAPASAAKELREIQRDIARRRRRRMTLLATRLLVFVLLPTLMVGWYYTFIATPMFATQSEFVIQQADAPSAGGMGGLFSGTALATSQDSITVQSYLQSREAMLRLDADHAFKAHFQDDRIDPIRRLDADATDEAAYRLYRRNVSIGYDPSEGIVRLEVIAADPATSAEFAQALIRYAEEQVDQLTQRLREDQMRGAVETYERAEQAMIDAQRRVVELQERFSILSSEVEVSLLTNQISALELELNNARLDLAELLANPQPNQARVGPLQRRIANLEDQIAALRAGLTQGGTGGDSLARVSSELAIAEANVATRQLMLSQALQQLEAARIEANRQVRYLSLGVSPIPPDEATYPKALQNTVLAFLIFSGLYLMVAMTAAILREQVSA